MPSCLVASCLESEMLRASPVLHGGSSRCAKYAVAEGSQFSGLLVARESPRDWPDPTPVASGTNNGKKKHFPAISRGDPNFPFPPTRPSRLISASICCAATVSLKAE